MFSSRQRNTATISAVCVVMPYSTWKIPVRRRRYRSRQSTTFLSRKDSVSWLPLETTSTRSPIRWTSSPLTVRFRSSMWRMSSFRPLTSCIVSIKPSTSTSFSSRSAFIRDRHPLPHFVQSLQLHITLLPNFSIMLFYYYKI